MIKEKLSNLYDIGSSKRVFQSEWREKGVPFFRAREIARLSEDGYVDNELFIDEDLYEEYTEKYGKPQPGDVMVTGVGTLGVCYVVKPEDKFYFKDGNILWFRQKAPERILPEYLVKAFDSKEVKDFIAKNSSGTTVGTFTIQTANKMEISLPALDQQKKIIERISKLEEIIKKRQLEIEKLDDLIKARFVEMFGDPCSNPMGHVKVSIKEAVDAGYIEKPLDGNHGEKHPKASEYVDDGVPFVMANNLANGVVDYDSCSKITRERADKLDKGFSHDGDVLITHKGTIGRTAIVHTKLDYIMLTPQVTYYRPLKGIKAEYLKGYFDTDYFQGEMKKLAVAGGSTRAYVGITNQTQLQLLIPSQDLQIQYSEFVEQVDKSKIEVQKALEKDQFLFESLMQKYFG